MTAPAGRLGRCLLALLLALSMALAIPVVHPQEAVAAAPAVVKVDWQSGISLPQTPTGVTKGKVESVAFADNQAAPEDAIKWDASKTGDGSVLGWATDGDGDRLYEVTYGGKGVYPSAPNSLTSMFAGFTALTDLDFSGFDTSGVTSMKSMFSGCKKLFSLDLSRFDMSKVETIEFMFNDCSSLAALNISGWDTNSLTKTGCAFKGCSSLKSLDVSDWDMSNVEIANSMFEGCSSLASLNVAGWDMSSATQVESMFRNCSSLTTLDLSWQNATKLGQMPYMFRNCSSLTALDLSGLDTSGVTNFREMFAGCSSLESLDLSGFDTTGVTSMISMFEGCSSLRSLDLSGFDMSGIRDYGGVSKMIDGTTGLQMLVLGDRFTVRPSSCYLGQPDAYAVKNGYTNVGRWVNKDTGEVYEDPSDIPAGAGTYTPFVVAYTVAFDKNADDATGAMAPQHMAYGQAKALAANAFERRGYAFAGWSTASDGTGTAYADKAEVGNLASEAGATVTLYAQWTKEPAPIPSPEPGAGQDGPATQPEPIRAETITLPATGDEALFAPVALTSVAALGALAVARRRLGL